ncbi:MAG: peptidoglycan DD-metalloendopeptidase family protein [Bacteroidaceae bacterium]|nr:peptidoglycan DD-metalloendopeptidase family protein [Bacteroidaceae bacterium]MBQ3130588.1 peptidoglycan DD-metalloendopeptidase family protein [Bacteroidaceae bacterium]MBR3982472.1 peptidoglycan DD-metalloendopeptidase family protein [Bacteroidaceae bacterium]
MHFLKTTEKKRTLMLSILAMFAFVAMAQDQLASVAPIDKRMRAIDSVSIAKMLEKESLGDPASSLYPNWNNNYTTNYGVEMPKEYKIDLRAFHFPCESRRVTSSYGYRRSFRRKHYGTDIKVYVGDTIRSAFSGKIRIVANQGRRKGYGKYVVIRHHNGLETVYGHLSKQLVVEDQEVKAGEPIGLGGNTGRSTGSHLHFETRFLGQFIDPEKLFDFTAQDVLGDYYLFSSVGRSRLLTSDESKQLPDNKVLASVGGPTFEADKAAQSKKFQEERRESLRAQVHKVRKGESLSVIARKRGTTVKRLCQLNNITTKTVLRVGQILRC